MCRHAYKQTHVIKYCSLLLFTCCFPLKLIQKVFRIESLWAAHQRKNFKSNPFGFRLFSWKVIWEIYFKQLLLSDWSKALEFQKCVILSRAIIKPYWTQTFHNMCSFKHTLAPQKASPEWKHAFSIVVLVLWMIFHLTSLCTTELQWISKTFWPHSYLVPAIRIWMFI